MMPLVSASIPLQWNLFYPHPLGPGVVRNSEVSTTLNKFIFGPEVHFPVHIQSVDPHSEQYHE